MSDLLIRDVDEETVRRIDADARRLGLTRAEYLRRQVRQLGHGAEPPVTREDLARSVEAFADLDDPDVMARAWS